VSRRTARTTRLAALLTTPVLLLGACGEETGSAEEGGQGLSAVTVTGDLGAEPKVAWEGDFDPGEVESEVLIEGDGAALEDGQQVFSRLYIGNGYSQSEAYSTFGEDAAPELLTVGEYPIPALEAALEGQRLGTRVVVAASPEDAFGGSGNAELGIGNADPVLFVVDVVSALPDGPSGTDEKAAGWAPAIVGEEDPTALDFAGTPEPTDKLRITTLIAGDGEPTEKDQTIYVDYLGQVYGGKEPFDASYEREAFSFPLGGGQVVKGWDQALEDVPVGSRVLLAVPPDQGYGEAGNPDAGIEATDTLYFVIDVLAAV